MNIEREVEVVITALAYGGSCVGEVVAGASDLIGIKAFVPFTIPGERVRAKVIKQRKRLLETALLEVLDASPLRRAPPCIYFGSCGGCDLQHVNANEQLRMKSELLLSTLARQARIEFHGEIEILGADLPEFHYRRRIRLQRGPGGSFGFFRRASNSVLEIARCEIAREPLNRAYAGAAAALNQLGAEYRALILEECGQAGEVYAALESRREGAALEGVRGDLRRAGVIDCLPNLAVHCGRKRFVINGDPAIHAGLFSQVNAAANALLVEKVRALFEGPAILDLYAGSGNFSLPLAQLGFEVTAVEADADLVEAGKIAAQGLKVNFVRSKCEEYLKQTDPAPEVLLDPPRAGAKEVAELLQRSAVKRCVYVSCNLASFARDARILVDRGFSLEKLMLVDMFPQTQYGESVAVFG